MKMIKLTPFADHSGSSEPIWLVVCNISSVICFGSGSKIFLMEPDSDGVIFVEESPEDIAAMINGED